MELSVEQQEILGMPENVSTIGLERRKIPLEYLGCRLACILHTKYYEVYVGRGYIRMAGITNEMGPVEDFILPIHTGFHPTIAAPEIVVTRLEPLPDYYDDIITNMGAHIDVYLSTDRMLLTLAVKDPDREMIEMDILPHRGGCILSLLTKI